LVDSVEFISRCRSICSAARHTLEKRLITINKTESMQKQRESCGSKPGGYDGGKHCRYMADKTPLSMHETSLFNASL
jgi:hypothetical protein